MPAKVVIAAGGTGGHLFPAQALAKELEGSGVEVLFGGDRLSENRYFHKDQFSFVDIASATPYKGNPLGSIARLGKGFWRAAQVLTAHRPQLVIGFGSFHSFPLLAAALVKKIPLLLVESDIVPGKVNRLFSRWARATAVQFAAASSHLAGKTVETAMPIWQKETYASVTTEEARAHFGLKPQLFTLLVFGGSQGALFINELLRASARALKEIQILHFTGDEKSAEVLASHYEAERIPACVKSFEHHMPLAWKAASLAISRAGAGTFAEQLAFTTPGILIPYPYATGGHQKKNALFMQNEVGGAVMCLESELTAESLVQTIETLREGGRLDQMRRALADFKCVKKDLSVLCKDIISSGSAASG